MEVPSSDTRHVERRAESGTKDQTVVLIVGSLLFPFGALDDKTGSFSAQRTLDGLAYQGATGFDPVPFRAQPLYGGNPWFLRIVELYYRLKDRAEGVRTARRR